MHPDLETFLEQALAPLASPSAKIGRIVVEPDYDAEPDPVEAGSLAEQFNECLETSVPEDGQLDTFDGQPVDLARAGALVQKYIRRVTLHAGPANGAAIEIAPPGNWI